MSCLNINMNQAVDHLFVHAYIGMYCFPSPFQGVLKFSVFLALGSGHKENHMVMRIMKKL
jgi:hypothetical protein